MNHTEQRFDPDKDTIVPKNSRPTSAQRKKRVASGSGQRKKNSTGQTNRRTYTKASAPAKRQAAYTRRRRRQKTSAAFKAMALIFIVVIIVVCALFIRNFGAGTRSDRQGITAYNSGNYDQAAQLFSQAVSYDRANAGYYIHLGMAQIQLTRFDDAISTFNEAESRTRQKDEIQAARRGKGIACLYKGDYAQALDAFNSALEFAGSKYTQQELDILYYLAETQDKNGDAVGSVLTYTKIIDQTGDADAYMLRGMAYQTVGDNTSAEKDLYQALEMNRKNYKVYLSLYDVLSAQGKEDEAAGVLEEAIGLSASSGEDYSNQGLIYMYMGNYEQADASFNTALEKDYVQANFGKAQNFMIQELYDDAISSFEAFFAQVSDNALAYNQYGMCLLETGAYEAAAEAFAQGIALNDRTVDMQLRFNEVNAYEKLGQWDQAYEKLQAYIEKYPEDTAAQKELAFLATRQNQG